MESQQPDPQEFDRSTEHFTVNQLQFLAERPKHKTHTAAAKAVGIKPDTVHVWTSRTPGFREILDDLVNKMDSALENFDEDQYMKDFVIPQSLQRVGEVIGMPITPGTSIDRARLIVNTSIKVLQGVGKLQPEGATVLSINVMAANSIKANRSYRPNWMTNKALPNPSPDHVPALSEDTSQPNSSLELSEQTDPEDTPSLSFPLLSNTGDDQPMSDQNDALDS
jgi:hypothetical protein